MMLKVFLACLFLGSIIYVHLRGHERHRFRKQLFDHSAFLAPLNVMLYTLSRVPTTPYLSVDGFEGLRELESHWETIRGEAEALRALRRIRASEKNDDAGFNSFFKQGWTRFYLKWYEETPPSAAQYCPQTAALLQRTPCIKGALFAELPPGAQLKRHRDPYAGSLRYHLGLSTPNDDRCRIWVDGEPYSWRDGAGVVFDETYIHWVRNDTDQSRLILLCDVERPLRFRWAEWINRAFARYVMTAAASPNDSGDRTGLISKMFYVSLLAGRYRRRFKAWNPAAYKVTQYGLMALVVTAIVTL
jgi:beta-hydroxylase